MSATELPLEPWRRAVAEVAAELDADVRNGLTAAATADRLARDGLNELDAAEVVPSGASCSTSSPTR